MSKVGQTDIYKEKPPQREYNEEQLSQESPLKMEHVALAMVLLVVGLIIAAVAFAAKLYW